MIVFDISSDGNGLEKLKRKIKVGYVLTAMIVRSAITRIVGILVLIRRYNLNNIKNI